MSEFDAIPPASFQPRGESRGFRWLYRGLALVALAGLVVLGLECLGIEVWPRDPEEWERFTYKMHDRGGSNDLFYNRKVPKELARAVGDRLHREGFFPPDYAVSVFFTRREGEYVLAFFFAGSSASEAEIQRLTVLRETLQRDVLSGEPLCIDLCDHRVNARRIPKLDVFRTIR